MITTVLAVDDEPKNLVLMRGFLPRAEYDVICADSGQQAWDILEKRYDEIDVILLDRMMPGIDGMELNGRIKAHPKMTTIPVIMQTAASQKEQIVQGIRAGVFYYLTKPYESKMLVTLVEAAVRDTRGIKDIVSEFDDYKNVQTFVDKCHLSFSTLKEACQLTFYLAAFFPDQDKASIGIRELLINAVEHGNLGIDFNEKGRLIREDCWQQEVERRLELPEYKQKCVTVSYNKTATEISITILDQGNGFNWQQFLTIDPNRTVVSHGIGIAIANMYSFDKIEFKGNGSEVCCTTKI